MAFERADAKPSRRWIAWLAGAALVILVVLALANRDQSPEVQVAAVKRENLAASITANGKVEPIQPYIAHALYATFVDRVEAVEGQAVRKGQLILVLNADSAKAQLAKARSNLLAAQAQLRNARAGGQPEQVAQLEGDLRQAQIDVANDQRTHEALQKLVPEKAATQDELDENQAELARAQAKLAALEQRKAAMAAQARLNAESAELEEQQDRDQMALLQNDVRSATVTSPLDGTLFSLPVRAGDYVPVGAVLAEMADLHLIRVRAFVDEPDLGSLEQGQQVEITWDALPGHVWTGRTETVPKQVVKQAVRSVGEVLCSVDNSQLELIPNVNVDVKIEVRERQNVLAVPRSAVHSDDSHHFVFVLSGSTLRQRPIQVGIANATEYEVISGLKEGEQVALSGDVILKDGMQVNPVEIK